MQNVEKGMVSGTSESLNVTGNSTIQ